MAVLPKELKALLERYENNGVLTYEAAEGVLDITYADDQDSEATHAIAVLVEYYEFNLTVRDEVDQHMGWEGFKKIGESSGGKVAYANKTEYEVDDIVRIFR